VFCVSCLVFASCSVSQPFPDRAAFAPDPGKAEKSGGGALTLRVMPLRVAKPYDAQLFNYKTGPSQFTQDYYAGFVAPPDRLLGAQLVDWLNDSGTVQYAAPAGTTLDCAANLEAQVNALYADHVANAAVIEMRVFVVSDPAGPNSAHILFQKVYEEKEPLAGRSPSAFITALNVAWRRTLTQLSADLRDVKIAPPPAADR
jgi:uncharacterized lipoprotein YmbA